MKLTRISFIISSFLFLPLLVFGQNNAVQSGSGDEDIMTVLGGRFVTILTAGNLNNPSRNGIVFGNGLSTHSRFTGEGRLGVGTGNDNPDNSFHVKSTAGTVAKIESTNNNSTMSFQNSNGIAGYVGISSGDRDIEVGTGQFFPGKAKLVTQGIARETATAGGNVGIGTDSPAFRLQVNGNTDIIGELTASSDMRLKEDFQSIDGAIAKVGALNPVLYNFKYETFPDMNLPTRKKMGFVAQDIVTVLPELVSEGTEVTTADGASFNSMSVNYVELIPLLTKAIQEQQAQIEELKTAVERLKEN